MSEIYLSIDESVALTGQSWKVLRRKANKEIYKTQKVSSEKNKGKFNTVFLLSSLKPEHQKKYWDSKKENLSLPVPSSNPEKEATFTPHPGLLPQREREIKEEPVVSEILSGEEQAAWYSELSVEHRDYIDSRLKLLDGFKAFYSGEGSRTVTLENYCSLKGISVGTYYRLELAFKKAGLPGLANKRFGQSRTSLDAKTQEYIEALIVDKPHRKAARICEFVCMEFPDLEVSDMTIRRYVSGWKVKNHELYTKLLNPDKWKDKYMLALGDASEKATHVNHYWELDSTPADIMCDDKKRYTIVGGIDIFSRRVKFRVAPRSNSLEIAALFRVCLLDWGIPENVVKDNGQDYASKHITGILKALEAGTPFVPHFTPEAKPHIERVFKTLAHGLLEELDGYIGHCVADRKEIEAQRTFAERLFDKDSSPIKMNISADKLQRMIDAWTENVYAPRYHRGLGESPEVKAAQSTKEIITIENESALDILLLPVGEATIQKSGISHKGGKYKAVEFADWSGEKVQVKIDLENAGVLYVFTLDGKRICTAYDKALHGISVEDCCKAKARQLKNINMQVKFVKENADRIDNPMEKLIKLKKEKANVVTFVRKKAADGELAAVIEGAKTVEGKAGAKPERYKSILDDMIDKGLCTAEKSEEIIDLGKEVPKLRLVPQQPLFESAEVEDEEEELLEWAADITVVNE